MCISILSTSHPDYPLILLSNRDEFINRPTLRAAWWDEPNGQVLGGRDNQRAERGTWLGITKQGRIAVLTNFRDEGVEVNAEKSRGKIPNAWLTDPPSHDESEEAFVNRLLNDLGIYDCGGFTLLFGKLRAPMRQASEEPSGSLPGLALISNRTSSTSHIQHIATRVGETHGLSNSWFGDSSWPKVVHGEALLSEAITANVAGGESQEKLLASLFEILSVDTLPRRKAGEAWEIYTRNMRKSIFIPAAKGEVVDNSSGQDLAVADGMSAASGTARVQAGQGAYGTRNQTVVLVNKDGKVTFVERTLYDGRGLPLPESERDQVIEFQIEGWHDTGAKPVLASKL